MALSIRRSFVFRLLALLLAGVLPTQGFADDEKRVQIEFLPPPMEGVISLGIYNKEGKLVRVLHKEDPFDAFIMALNGLVTYWDGKDDAGNLCPSGQYNAKGYLVSEDLEVEGIGFIGNEWMTDDESPRITRIEAISARSETELLVRAKVPGSKESALFLASPEATPTPEASPEPPAEPEAEPEATPDPNADTAPEATEEEDSPDWKLTPLPAGETPVFEARPPSDTGVEWEIRDGTLHQFITGQPDFPIVNPTPEEAKPEQLAVSASRRALFVLDEGPTLQRLFGLGFNEPTDRPDDATALFVKTIHFSDTLEQITPQLTFPDGKAFKPSKTVRIALVRNPLLLRQHSTPLELKAVAFPDGTYLTSADGLPLDQISETPHLRWAALGRSSSRSKELVVFESDGAVVSEFRIRRFNKMMSFDAGDFKWRTPKTAAVPDASPAATVSEP